MAIGLPLKRNLVRYPWKVPPALEELRCSTSQFPSTKEALSVSPVSRGIDRIGVTFDEPSLVADAGLIVPAT